MSFHDIGGQRKGRANPVTAARASGRGSPSAVSRRASGRADARYTAALTGLEQFAAAHTPEQQFLDEAVCLVCEALQAPLAKVLELDDSGKQLLVRAGAGWPAGVVGNTRIPAAPSSQAGHTVGYREAVIFDDLSGTKRFADAGLLRSQGVISSLSVTIADSDRSLGVLGVHYRCRRDFTEEELRFLEHAAAIIGRGLSRRRRPETPAVPP